MNPIHIENVRQQDQRYSTLGDYFEGKNGVIEIRISNLGNSDFEFLITLHELCEQYLVRKMGISNETIDAWDLAHSDADEPGDLEGCPYRDAHEWAAAMEQVMGAKLGVDWDEYEK